eukprot:TRINITY_DN4406_c0_g1_i1.p1 TRINITY_DN4406_c0_g1~~TRINITY_DN4406_c0_g1_i1.p1  ORF type:complete len:444 (+),score=91.48 TRINITY_DN4406_c0_g1_i1:156-1334(+)
MVSERKSSELASPLLAPSKATVYSPYGPKQVVEVQASSITGSCLTGLLKGSAGNIEQQDSAEVMLVITSSVWINFFLMICKAYAFVVSGSLAVLASLVDSVIDLLGQGALMWTTMLAASGSHEEYPVGRGRLEPVGVMICAVVMGMASMEVISQSSMRLLKYWDRHDAPHSGLTDSTAALLVGIILLKAVLWQWSSRVSDRNPNNDSVKAIAQDNYNDVLSNIVALVAPSLVVIGYNFWIADPLAGVGISVYIIYNWFVTGYEQVEKIVGKRADPEFLQKVKDIAEQHDQRMELDQLNAYHFGPKYLVELEVVMPEATTLRDSHDCGITLQHKIEMLEECERCFVHIDYQMREHDDHDPDVPIERKIYGAPLRSSPRADAVLPPLLADGPAV